MTFDIGEVIRIHAHAALETMMSTKVYDRPVARAWWRGDFYSPGSHGPTQIDFDSVKRSTYSESWIATAEQKVRACEAEMTMKARGVTRAADTLLAELLRGADPYDGAEYVALYEPPADFMQGFIGDEFPDPFDEQIGRRRTFRIIPAIRMVMSGIGPTYRESVHVVGVSFEEVGA